ncbi:MAG: addiction module protein [Verrucomicrobiota bacterium]
MTLEELKVEAVRLGDDEKGALIDDLIESMSPPSYWVSDEEVRERAKELETGEVKGISFEELARRVGR